MRRAWTNLWAPPQVYLPAALALLMAIATLAPLPHLAAGFARYFGGAPSPIALLVCGMIGAFSLAALRAQGWFQERQNVAPALLGAALIFGGIVILADCFLRYPADINVGLPAALLFYPAVAIAAQAILHLAPLALLVFLARKAGIVSIWPPVLLASAIEPMFQIAAAFAGGARDLFTAVHVFAFSVVELLLLRRGGYGAMYGFRLCYYLVWHIVWGAARLSLGW